MVLLTLSANHFALRFSHNEGQQPCHYRNNHIDRDPDRKAPSEEHVPVIRVWPFASAIDEDVNDVDNADKDHAEPRPGHHDCDADINDPSDFLFHVSLTMFSLPSDPSCLILAASTGEPLSAILVYLTASLFALSSCLLLPVALII